MKGYRVRSRDNRPEIGFQCWFHLSLYINRGDYQALYYVIPLVMMAIRSGNQLAKTLQTSIAKLPWAIISLWYIVLGEATCGLVPHIGPYHCHSYEIRFPYFLIPSSCVNYFHTRLPETDSEHPTPPHHDINSAHTTLANGFRAIAVNGFRYKYTHTHSPQLGTMRHYYSYCSL